MSESKMHTLTAPFQIGDVYWLPSTLPRNETIPCPICAGEKVVTVLAAAEHFRVECDACGLGYEGPRGWVTEWHHDPHAVPFTIAEVVRVDGDTWTVKSSAGLEARFSDLRTTEEGALATSADAYRKQEERNMSQRRHRRKGVSKAAWTVRYHTDAIKKLERELAYHRSKIAQGAPR